MLIIKRKVNESILIGEDIEVIISEISGDKVKIAINAPSNIRIFRKEIKETSDFNQNAIIDFDKDKIKALKVGLKKVK